MAIGLPDMLSISLPRLLPSNFLERLNALQREADEAGQTDVAYTLELAAQMAEMRKNAREKGARERRATDRQTLPWPD